MTFYTGDKLPKWKGDIFVGGQRTGGIPGTGHLERVLVNEKLEELRREALLVPLRMRIRDVRQGPDELLYVLVDHGRTEASFGIEAVRFAAETDDLVRAPAALTRRRITGQPRNYMPLRKLA